VPRPEAISPRQAEAVRLGALPPLEQVRPGVWSLALPFGLGIDDYSLGYVIEAADGSIALLDPGWDTDDNLARIEAALHQVGHALGDLTLLVVTHLHPDHVGLATRLRDRTGARIVLHPAEQEALRSGHGTGNAAAFARWGVPADRRPELVRSWGAGRTFPPMEADLLVEDGEELPLPGVRITAVATPGHTSGSLCFADAERRLFFSGDHVLPTLYPGIGLGGAVPAGNPLADYLASLDHVAAYDGFEVCPGHGYRFSGLADRCAVIAAHQRRRTAEVAVALDELMLPTLWAVAAAISWSAGWEALREYRLGSALTQTAMHIELLGRTGELARGS
jgi:glyoxylase-like metal-dependent hydrolase (beta-lactamase superfamily II)